MHWLTYSAIENCLKITIIIILAILDAGWRAKVIPGSHPVSEFIFDVCFSADGKRNTMTGNDR